jgi:hypothetical protein
MFEKDGEDQSDRKKGKCRSVRFYKLKEERKSLNTIKIRRDNWIGDILRRNCLLKHLIEGRVGNIEEMRAKRQRREEEE